MLTKVFSPRLWLYLATFLLVMLVACSKPVTPPPPPEMPNNLEAGWNRIAPEGETICANGSEYAFFVDPGTVNKLVVDFDGGGACWNDGTCSQPSNPENEFGGVYIDGVYGSPEDFGYNGIFDRENEDNPFRDWYHVYISYCTGDLHLGDNLATYTGPDGEFRVNHNGAANARSALGWIFDNFSAPETVLVTGISAGAYASIVWLPEIAKAYPEADLYQLGDSGAGVVTDTFFTGDAANWRLEDALPDLSEPVVLDENAIINLYTGVGRDYPEAVLSQYNSLLDGTQIGFYGLMQGVSPPTEEVSLEWSAKMTASLVALTEATPDFRAYVSILDVDNDPANGTSHVILNRPEFYTLEMNGVRFADWLGDLVSGREVESVTPSPGDAPASALGDSPTISGTILNLGRGNFSGKVLELKAGQFTAGPEDVYATSPVEGDGSFSLQLPGAAEMAPKLMIGRPEVFFGYPPECDVTIAPKDFRLALAQDFFLFVNGQMMNKVIQTREGDPYTLASHMYVDQDVRAVGSCVGGMLDGFEINIDLRSGWNLLVVDLTALTYRNEDPGEGFRWVIPDLCNSNGECPAN